MANPYYNHGSFPAQGAAGASASMRSELDAITAGFNLLPAFTANSITPAGGNTFSWTLGNTLAFTLTGATALTLPTAGTLLSTASGTAVLATGLAGGAAGQIPYQSGAGVTAYSAAGTSGQVLISGGASSPTWLSTLGSGSVVLASAITGTGSIVASNSPLLVNPTVTNPANTKQTLTDAATISWDMNLGSIAQITLGGLRTMAAPTNLKIGTYLLEVNQDGSGSRTLTWNAIFKWPSGVAPVLTTTASRKDLISIYCDGTNLYGAATIDIR